MGMKSFQIGDKITLTIHELDDVCDSVTGRPLTGSWVWDSALILSEFMERQQAQLGFDFRDKTVLELGAGAGLPGLTAAQLGASRVLLTDIQPLLGGLKRNAEGNKLEDVVEVRELVWGSVSSSDSWGEFDVVLMSDVFFDPTVMGDLGKTLRSLCKGKGKGRVWAASEVRPWTSECLNELVSLGLEVVELETCFDRNVFGFGRPAPAGPAAAAAAVTVELASLRVVFYSEQMVGSREDSSSPEHKIIKITFRRAYCG
ncbi:Lysine methyltransferase [Dillenia turbinata]|uniref:Lysine methyltransferase n=1 Tax=Dillenia turbinata TaxID=194707 RepID=A0AAN8W7N0_9MAGN